MAANRYRTTDLGSRLLIHSGAEMHADFSFQQLSPREGHVLIGQASLYYRLYDETWLLPEYDLIPKLRELDIPTLVINGDEDLIPVEVASRIAQAMPGGLLSVLQGCGHFA